MQCSSCGMALPTGAMFCTNCGVKVSNQGTPGTQPPESSQVNPTIPASPYYDPAQFASPSSQPATPPNAYGAPSYSTPQQYSYDAPPPPSAYGVSPSPNLYGTPPPPPPNSYVASPPPSNPYGAPYAPPPGSFIPPNQPPTRRQGPRIGLIIGIVVLLLLLIGGGILALRATHSGSQVNNNTATTTPSSATTSTSSAVTPATQGVAPSGSPVDSTAAAIITHAQTASAIDSNYIPTKLTSDFTIGQTVYVTFHLTLNGQSGYAEAKLYSNTTYIGNKILAVQSGYDHGYFNAQLNQAATGIIELYWCTQSNCSDAKLATFVTFKVA
jgi:flagellar basal body-associated protein FliL